MNALTFTRHVPAIGTVQSFTVPVGASIADMAAMQGRFDHAGGTILAYVQVRPGYWEEAPRDRWALIRPKRDGVVRFYARLQGGGDGQILALVATIAISAIAGPLGTSMATAMLGFGHAVAGSAAFGLASSLFTAGITLGGSYLLSRLFPGEQQSSAAAANQPKSSSFAAVEADANLLGRYAYPPRVFGTRRIAMPDAVHPRQYLDGGVPTIERLLIAGGPHMVEDVRVDGNLASDMPGLTVQTRDGLPGTPVTTMVTEISSPKAIGETLDTFRLDDRDLEDQETPANSAPVPLRFKAKKIAGMSEISIRAQIDALIKTTSPTTSVRLALRIRMRPDGGGDGDWINFPEAHLKGIDQGSNLIEIRVRRDTAFSGGDPDGSISYEFWREVPEVTAWTLADGSTGTQWTAHSHFATGSGLQDVTYFYGRRSGLRAVLSEALFPDGAYEFEIQRSIVTDSSSLNTSYQISGNVVSLFDARNESGVWRIPVAQADYQTRVTIHHATVVAPIQPVQRPGTTVVALRSRGQSVRGVTTKLTGYAKEWDGAAFTTWGTSNNPAIQTRQLLEDLVRYSRVAEYSRLPRIAAAATSVLVNTDWTGWEAQCTAMGASCSLVAAGEPVNEVLARLLASGLARPAFGPKLRIDYYRDRSGDEPGITFSPRNASITLKYEAPPRPMGLRAAYQNKNLDWADDELEVRTPLTGNTPNWLSSEIKAIDDPAWLEARLVFDLLRPVYWRTRYEVRTDIEGMALKPGTLVGIVTDLVDDRAHGARVSEVIDNQTLRIDQIIPAEATLTDLDQTWDFDDLFEVGEQSFVQLTTPTGCELKTIIDAYDRTIVVDSAFSSTSLEGAHLSIGSLTNRIRRCIVVDPAMGGEFGSTVICADEAPEMYDYMKTRFGWAA